MGVPTSPLRLSTRSLCTQQCALTVYAPSAGAKPHVPHPAKRSARHTQPQLARAASTLQAPPMGGMTPTGPLSVTHCASWSLQRPQHGKGDDMWARRRGAPGGGGRAPAVGEGGADSGVPECAANSVPGRGGRAGGERDQRRPPRRLPVQQRDAAVRPAQGQGERAHCWPHH